MAKLKKELTLYGLTMVAIGSCIGSGIFLTPSQIAGDLPSSLLIIIVWITGGLVALTGALTFAELSAMMPKTGGVYAYLKECYGSLFGFLYGWAYLLVISSGAIAALSIAFAYYIGFLIPLSDTGQIIVAIIAIIIVTLINIFRAKYAEIFSNIFTGLKLIGIILLIVIGLLLGSSETFTLNIPEKIPDSGSWITAFGLALVGVLWSYGGWQHASYVSGEAINAKRNIPRAMVIGALIVSVAYILTNLSFMYLLPIDKMAESKSIAADAIKTILPYGGIIIALLIAISTFGTAGIYTLSSPRIYYAMAADGLFFKKIADIHPRFHTPVNAIIVQSTWAIILLIFWGTFENVITYVTFTDWIFFTLTACIVIIFRYKRKETFRSYKTFGYPVTPLIFIFISAAFVINTLIKKPLQAWAGLILLFIGIPVFIYFNYQKKKIKQ